MTEPLAAGAGTISANTRVFGVVGDPVSHSFSPAIHNFWLRQARIDAVYVAFRLAASKPEAILRMVAAFGLAGLNITLPHKAAALAAASRASPEARAVGVANTLSLQDDGSWRADNTDVEGFDVCLHTALSGSASAKDNALVIGAGGAARAVIHALNRGGYGLTIANRRPERARALADALAPEAEVCGLNGLAGAMETTDLVVHTTSVGHLPGEIDWHFPDRDGTLFLDISYGAAAQPLLRRAAAQGWRTADGLVMLVAQAAASHRIWFGRDPDIPEAVELCRSMRS